MESGAELLIVLNELCERCFLRLSGIVHTETDVIDALEQDRLLDTWSVVGVDSDATHQRPSQKRRSDLVSTDARIQDPNVLGRGLGLHASQEIAWPTCVRSLMSCEAISDTVSQGDNS